MIYWIEYYDYKYYLTEGVFNGQHSFISLSRMSSQPSKKDVGWLVRKAVLVLCNVIWLVIGPVIKKIGEWLKSRLLTSDWNHFFRDCAIPWLFFVFELGEIVVPRPRWGPSEGDEKKRSVIVFFFDLKNGEITAVCNLYFAVCSGRCVSSRKEVEMRQKWSRNTFFLFNIKKFNNVWGILFYFNDTL